MGNKRILVIEDEQLLRQALVDKLGLEGFELLEASDGKEGLDTALSNHPDLILLDVVMPEMDGITMLKKLREDEWGKTVPVIILTNLTSSDKVEESIKSGASDYLIKANYKIEDVVKMVREKLSLVS